MHILYQETSFLMVMSVAKVNFTTYNMMAYCPSFPNLSSPAAEALGFGDGFMYHKLHFIVGMWGECGTIQLFLGEF